MVENKTIAAISTPQATGGISVIRISGSKAIAVADRVFKGINGQKLSEKKGYTAAYGEVYSGEKLLDQSVATVFRAPKSYTGEDVVELSCHGGIIITREVLRAVLTAGASPAAAGEFTKRAFVNGKTSLTQAEAVVDLLNSENVQALNAAREQQNGALFRKIEAVKTELVTIDGHIAAWIDYPEEDIAEVENGSLCDSLCAMQSEMTRLISTFDKGKVIKEGINTAIIGKPNVGKSTLMNLLVGSQKSIVTDVAGTTRDVVEESVNIGAVTLRLSDTAGIRETEDKVERLGVALAKDRLSAAALIIAVFDSSNALDGDDLRLIESIGDVPSLAVINKNDLGSSLDRTALADKFSAVIEISAVNEMSREVLFDALEKLTAQWTFDPSAGIIANERQLFAAQQARLLIGEAARAVKSGATLDAVGVIIDDAIEFLSELTGQSASEEVVNQVFSHFCVGK